MVLLFGSKVDHESRCHEVSESITWRRFCRIWMDGLMPHPTTLMTLTIRRDTAAVNAPRHRRALRGTVNWRTGGEARIGALQ